MHPLTHPPQIELPQAIKLLQVGFGEERGREGTNYSLVAHRINLPSSEAIRKDKERGERSPRNKKRWALVGIIYRVTMDLFGSIFY